MGYDEELAARVRSAVGPRDDVTEKQMFGGLAFLVAGNMAVCASGQGGLMVRLEPAETAAALERPGASPMVMRGKELDGWLRVSDEVLDDATLQRWVDVGVGYAAGLPPR